MELKKTLVCLIADLKGSLFVSPETGRYLKKSLKEPLKVVRCISRLNIGGPSIHASLLHHHLYPGHFKTLLVTGRISDEEGDMAYLFKKKDASIFYIPELRREIHLIRDLIAFFKLVKFFFSVKPDILHTHLSKAGAIARSAAIFYNLFTDKKITLYHTFHGNIFNGYFGKITTTVFRYLEIFLARFTRKVIAISETQKEEICTVYGITRPEKVKIIQLGFDLSAFLDSQTRKGDFRKAHGIDNKTLLIGIIGRMVPIKNHLLFLQTAKKIMERSKVASVQFILVGDGELRPELEGFVRGNHLESVVHFLGWQKDISGILSDLDILMMTSFNEGTPVSIIEAMASGVPVISSDVGGIKDLLGEADPQSNSVDKGFYLCERGILCPTHDAMGFVHAVEYMVQSGYLNKNAIKNKMRQYVINHYTQKRLLKDISGLYMNLSN